MSLQIEKEEHISDLLITGSNTVVGITNKGKLGIVNFTIEEGMLMLGEIIASKQEESYFRLSVHPSKDNMLITYGKEGFTLLLVK